MARILITKHRLAGLFHLLVNGLSVGQVQVGVEADLDEAHLESLKASDPDCVFTVLDDPETATFKRGVEAMTFLDSLGPEMRNKVLDHFYAERDIQRVEPPAAGSETPAAAPPSGTDLGPAAEQPEPTPPTTGSAEEPAQVATTEQTEPAQQPGS